MEKFPVIDLSPYLKWKTSGNDNENEESIRELCREVSRTLKKTGALLIRDPRCTIEDNDRFLDMMEEYFEKPPEFKRLQERPQLHYQVGVTPEGVEVPRSLVDVEMQDKLTGLAQDVKPSTPNGPDRKWRYMWRIGTRPADTRFVELNAEPVIPDGFDQWKETMDSWGFKMVKATQVVAEMAAIGFGLDKDAFTSLMNQVVFFMSMHANFSVTSREMIVFSFSRGVKDLLFFGFGV